MTQINSAFHIVTQTNIFKRQHLERARPRFYSKPKKGHFIPRLVKRVEDKLGLCYKTGHPRPTSLPFIATYYTFRACVKLTTIGRYN